MNNCSFIGRMGAQPKYFPGDQNKKSIIMFSLAVKKNFQVKQGEPDCYWLNFKAFGTKADVINKHVAKGQLLGVSATANVETYKDQAGQDKTTVNFLVNDITFCEKSGAAGNGNNASQGNTQQPSNTTSNYQPQQYQPSDDDDLPF